MVDKDQVLNFLANVKRKQGRGSSKYYNTGVARILVKKDIISVDDIIHEFPELDQPESPPQQLPPPRPQEQK